MGTTFDELVGKFEWNLLAVAKRQFVIEAFKADLDKITRGKLFRIRNDIVWSMLLDTRDMLVVHLASWAKGVYEKGGLIGQLQAHHCRDLPRARPKTERDDDEGWTRRRDREHAESFGRLFPSSKERYPEPADVEELRSRFIDRTAPLLDDRSQNRAHPYEKEREPGSVRMLDIPDLRETISFSEQLMNDLTMVARGSTLHYDDMNNASPDDVARELVDTILLGTADRGARKKAQSEREAFYQAVHARHDTAPPSPPLASESPERYFNDYIFDL